MAAASSSSGDGPSTSGSGGRSNERPLYWDFVPVKVVDAHVNDVDLRELNRAAMNEDIVLARKSAKKLKKRGTSVDAAVAAYANPKSKRYGPLHVAASTKYLQMCKMLVKEYNCNPDAAATDGTTPLFFAALEKGSQAVVEYLINSGADPNKANDRGITPLHYAAKLGYCEVAECLLSKGANVDPICQDGEAPLHVAAYHGHARMVKLLLMHNADPNRISLYRHTPLVASLFCPKKVGSSLECLELFIEAGAPVNTVSPVTPLSVAAREGLADCITCLLDNNADPNKPDEDDKLPIQIAASRGWAACVEILLPVTNPLQKYADLSINQMVERESIACQLELLRAIADGDVAFWEKEYAHALVCYNKALRLGHGDPALHAKKSLCYLYKHDQLRYSDFAVSYMKLMKPDSKTPYLEEDATRLVLEYYMEWKAHRV